MRIGTLRHRISIEKLVNTIDEYGGRKEEWETIGTVWGSIEPVSGKEWFTAKQTQSERTTKIRIRWNSIFLENANEYRLRYGDRLYDIMTLMPDNDMSQIVIMCKDYTHGKTA